MAIEKLEREHCYLSVRCDNYCGMEPAENGEYVLYEAARVREDALLRALHKTLDNCIFGPTDVLDKVQDVIREIEETR